MCACAWVSGWTTPPNKMATPNRSCAEEMAAREQASAMPATAGGGRSVSPDQEHDFLEEPPRDYYCAVSLDLLLEPFQTGCCGHHLSREVVDRLQREGKPCPMCNRPNFPAVRDIYMQRKIKELQVRCRYNGGGCVWTGQLFDKDAHMRTCPKQPWSCPHCQFAGLREAAQEHTEGCAQVPVHCPNQCEARQVPRCQLSVHLDRDCPLQQVACKFSHVGCTEELVRSQLAAHIQNMQMHHTMLMCSANLDLTRQLNEKLTEKDAQIEALRGDVVRLERELGQRVQAVEAGVAAQSEWMESQQRENQNDENLQEPVLTEEIVKTVVTERLRETEMFLRELKKEVEGVRGAVDENRRLAVQEMTEEQEKGVGKLDELVKQVEQDREAAREDFKNWEMTLKEERELVAKTTEETMRRALGEVERTVVDEVKKSMKEVESSVMRELVKEGGKREEVRREIGAVGEKVRAVETHIKATEGKITAEMSALKTNMEKEMEETRVKIIGGEKVEPAATVSPVQRYVRRGKSKAASRSVTSDWVLSTPRIIPIQGVESSSVVAPIPLAKHVSEEDANRKPKPVTTTYVPQSRLDLVPSVGSVPHSMLDLIPSVGLGDGDLPGVKVIDPQRRLPPCGFEIRNFFKLKEGNKEWRSDPFYSREGYKMCLGVWPNGFRSGAGTHVSVEFYKMKDASTDRLKWNVKLPIHVRIFNYRTKMWEREHVNGETFTRSKVSGEFETSGYAQSHKLVAHDDLEPYLHDDKFMIQVYKFELKL